MQERHSLAQRRRRIGPAQRTELRRPHPRHQCRGGLVARFRTADTLAELDRSESTLDRFDQVVAAGVPLERPTFDDLRAELGDDVLRVDHGGEADPGPLPATVEVGSNEKRLVCERVVVGQPCARAGAQLELAGASPRGQPVGVAEQEDHARPIGIDVVEVEADTGPPGEIAGPVPQTVYGAPVGRIVAAAAGQRTDAQRQIGGQVVGAPPEDVAFLDQRGDHAGER